MADRGQNKDERFVKPVQIIAGVEDTDVTTAVLLGDASNTESNTNNKTLLGKSNEILTNILSAGYLSGGAITDNGDGTIKVEAGDGYIKVSDNDTAVLKYITWTEQSSIALTDNSENYIYVDYFGGTPTLKKATSGSAIRNNENDKFELYEVYREGTNLHITEHKQFSNNVMRRLQQRIYSINKIERANADGGLILGETGTRNPTVSAGTVWVKLNETAIAAIDTSGSDKYCQFYRDGGGGWTEVTGSTQWDNTQYDDNSGSLATLTAQKFSFQEFYLESDGALNSVYGQDEYVSLAGAESADVITTVPGRLSSAHTLYIGRIVFQKSDATAQSIPNPFETQLSFSAATNHNNLSDLQLSASSVTYGHVDDQTQTIVGAKTFSGVTTFSNQIDVDNININGNILSSTDTDGDMLLKPDGTGVLGNIGNADGNYQLFFANLPTATESIDQSQLTSDVFTQGAVEMWQSFTTASAGLLTAVEPYISLFIGSVTEITYRVYEGNGTGGTLLATQVIPNPTAGGYIKATFYLPPLVASATQYTFSVEPTAGGGLIRWDYINANVYAGGRFFLGIGQLDGKFRTYISTETGLSLSRSNGYFGLNVPEPTELLDINGSIKVADKIYLGAGGTDCGKLILSGTVSSVDGPHIAAFVSGDDTYPVFQQWNGNHNQILQLFDCKYDGTDVRSSSVDSNYAIGKEAGALGISGASGFSPGDVVSFNTCLAVLPDGSAHFFEDVDVDGALTASTLDTGQGANELYDMNQNVTTSSAVTFSTVNTGQGANELYDMNQNVLTSSGVTFVSANINGTMGADKMRIDDPYSTSSTSGQNDLWRQASTGNFYINTSTSRSKKEIDDMGDVSWLYDLRPVTFLEKNPELDDGILQYGLIAEEVAQVNRSFVNIDEGGEPYAVHYKMLASPLLQAVQIHEMEIKNIEGRLSALEALN